MDLPCHRCLRNSPTSEESNRPTDATDSDPIKVVAQFGQPGIGMVSNANAGDATTLFAHCLSYRKGKSTPTSKQAQGLVT